MDDPKKKYPPGFTPDNGTDTLPLPKGFVPESAKKKDSIPAVSLTEEQLNSPVSVDASQYKLGGSLFGNALKSLNIPEENMVLSGALQVPDSKSLFDGELPESVTDFNKQFEELTGHREFSLSEPTKNTGLLTSDVGKGQRKSFEQQKFLTYRKGKQKLDEASKSIYFGDISTQELLDMQSNPITRNVTNRIIKEYVPAAPDDSLENPETVELARKNIVEKNRVNYVNAETVAIGQLDDVIGSSVAELSQPIDIKQGGTATNNINELRAGLGGVANLKNNDEISNAIAQVNKIQDAEQSYVGSTIKSTIEERNKFKQKTASVLQALNDRLQYNISKQGITPTISQLNEQIEKSVGERLLSVEAGEGGKESDFENTKAKKIDQFKLGLTAIEKSDPILFKNVTNAIAAEGKIAPTDFSQIASVGQQIYNKRVFGGAAYNPELIDKESSYDYTTFEEKVAAASGQVGEWFKDNGYKNYFEFPEKLIRTAAKEKGISNSLVVDAMVFNEKILGYDQIPKSGALDDIIAGIAQPLDGINSTISSWTESPAETYLRSNSLTEGLTAKVPDDKGNYSDLLPSERGRFLTDMFRGTGQFVTQVLLTKGVGGAAKAITGLAVPLSAVQAKNVVDYGGTFVSTFLQSYGPSYEEHLQKTGDANTAALIATIDGISAAAFEEILPDVKIASGAMRGLTKGLSGDLMTLVKKGGDPAELALKARPFVQKFFQNATTTIAKENIEELGTNYTDFVVESIFDPASAKERNLNKELWDTFKSTTAAMLLPSIIGGGASAYQKDFTQNSLHAAAINFDSYKESLQNSLDKGYMSQDDYNDAIKILTTHRESIIGAPEINANEERLSTRQRMDYALEDTKIKVYKQKSEKAEGVAKEMWDGKIAAAEDVQREILMPEAKPVVEKEISPVVEEKITEVAAEEKPVITPEVVSTPIERSKGDVVDETDVVITKDNYKEWIDYLKKGGELSGSDLIDLRNAANASYREKQKPNDEKFDRDKNLKEWKDENDRLMKEYFKESDYLSNLPNSYGLEGDVNAKETYHFTDPQSLLSILDVNHIYGEGETSGVSTTTNKAFDHPELTQVQAYGEGNKPLTFAEKGVRIDLDLPKLKEDGVRIKKGSEHIGTFEGEFELRVGKYEGVENASKYIKQIQVDRKIVDEKTFEEIKQAADKLGIKVVEKTDYERPVSKIKKPKANEQTTPTESETIILAEESGKPKVRVSAEQLQERQPAAIRQKYIDDFNIVEDSSFDFRVKSELSTEDRKKAVADIQSGKNTAAARKLEQEIKDTQDRGTVIINRGRGNNAQTVEIPIDEWFQLEPIEQENVFKTADEMDDFTTSIIADNDITLDNIDDLKHLFNGFPYDQERFQQVKDYLSTESNVSDQTAQVSQEGQQPATEKTITEKGKEFADRIRSLKSKKDTLQANVFGIPVALYDGALEVIATAVENGAKLVDAIRDGMNSIPEKERKNLDIERFSKHIEDAAEGKKPKIRTTGEVIKPPKPPKKEQVDEEDETTPKRRFTQRLLDDPNIDEEAKDKIRENLEYVRQRNSVSVANANRIINDVGVEEAYHLVTSDLTLNGAVRTVIGETLIKKFNDLAANADNEPERLHYIQRTSDIADYVAEQLGTIPGQIIQALSLYARLTPEAQLLAATKQARRDGNRRAKRQRRRVNDIGDKLQKANEEVVDQLTSEGKTKPAVEKAQKSTVQKGKDKVQAARDRRKKLLDKYKGDKGSGLTLSSGGLTKEGIEYVGGLIKTYIDEGLANVQIIAGHIIQHLKDAGAKINDDVEKNVNDIVEENVNRVIDRSVTKSLFELEQDVNRIVKEHYTVPAVVGESLKQKFINQIGLDWQDAEQLEKEIHKEFEKISTRKKNDILFKEKAKFDKIQSGMEGNKKVEKKTLHDEIIKYTNLGAFDNDNFSKFLSDKLGLGQLTPEEGKKLTDLAKKIQDAPEGSPKNDATQDLLAYRANLKGTNWGEVVQGAWYANILSGYGTHIKNIVSTFFNGAAFFASESARSPRSIPVLLAGAARGLHRGLVEAAHTVKTGRSPIHVSKIEIPGVLERQKFVGGLLNPYNWLKFVGRLMVAEDVLQFQALKEMRATQLAYKEARKSGSKNPFSKATWKIINEKLLNTKERSEDAIAQAESEGFKKKTVEWKRRVYELMELSRPIQMTEDAYGFAAKGTFNHANEGTLGALTNALTSIIDVPIGGVKPLRFVVPFTRILTNVVNTALDFTPVGFVRAIRGKRGFESFDKFHPTKGAYVELTDEERKQLVARASLGIGLTTALYAMTKIPCKEGHNMIEITGGGTGNYLKDDQLKQTGWQPYSVRVCGGDYFSYKLTPMVLNLSMIGNMGDFEKYNPKASEASFMKKVMMGAWETKSVMLDMTWVASTTQFMQHLSSDNPQQEMKGFFRQLENNAKQLVIPNFFTQASQRVQSLFNMPQKQADNIWERFIQDIPVARNSLNDKINALGDPITRDVDVLYSSLKKDPVWDYLNEKGGWVAPVNKNTLIVYDFNTDEDRPATADEYYEFSKLRGNLIRQEIENLIAGGVTIETDEETISKDAYELTKDELKTVLTKISGEATRLAKAQLFGESEKQSKSIQLNESINNDF